MLEGPCVPDGGRLLDEVLPEDFVEVLPAGVGTVPAQLGHVVDKFLWAGRQFRLLEGFG